ncbi:hypothetical protein F5B17DRAFT_432484 [Nemania serpens]|nr:hypothetical protein F5B17DRAFT_432484 [Nemania serpens]
MHVPSLITIAALALGLGHSAQGAHTYSKLHFSTSSVCGTTKWKYETNATAPKTEDCVNLALGFRKHSKDGYTLQGWGAKDTGEDGDAADLLEDAASQFASGSMSCRAYWDSYGSQTIEWRIFTFGS